MLMHFLFIVTLFWKIMYHKAHPFILKDLTCLFFLHKHLNLRLIFPAVSVGWFCLFLCLCFILCTIIS